MDAQNETLAGQQARGLLDEVFAKKEHQIELDREIFEKVYGLDYKNPFKLFCETGEIKSEVINFCRTQIATDKS